MKILLSKHYKVGFEKILVTIMQFQNQNHKESASIFCFIGCDCKYYAHKGNLWKPTSLCLYAYYS